MSKQGVTILNTLYEENVITLDDMQHFIDSKKKKPVQRVKSKIIMSKPDKRPETYVDPCSRGSFGGGGRC